MILKAKFCKDGIPLYFVVNNSEQDAYLTWKWENLDSVQVWNPEDGEITYCHNKSKLFIKAYQGVFLIED